MQLAALLGAPARTSARIDLLDLVAERREPERVRQPLAPDRSSGPASACRGARRRARASPRSWSCRRRPSRRRRGSVAPAAHRPGEDGTVCPRIARTRWYATTAAHDEARADRHRRRPRPQSVTVEGPLADGRFRVAIDGAEQARRRARDPARAPGRCVIDGAQLRRRSRPRAAPASPPRSARARRCSRSRTRCTSGSRARPRAARRRRAARRMRAPIAGKVVKVLVAVGDQVAPGTPVIVLEAMKMENELVAERGGTVGCRRPQGRRAGRRPRRPPRRADLTAGCPSRRVRTDSCARLVRATRVRRIVGSCDHALSRPRS